MTSFTAVRVQRFDTLYDPTPSCSGLQSKWVGTAISAFSGPHSLHLSPTSGPHYLRLSLQSSGRDCNPSPQDRIICN
jgi:hypothetical protein